MIYLLLLACTQGKESLNNPSNACSCEGATDAPFTVSDSGGFDDWGGAALGWAVDTTEGWVLVVGVRYQTGVGSINFTASCENASKVSDDWYPSIPPSGNSGVAQYPLLGAALTTSAGVRSLSEDIGALLLVGDLNSTTPKRVYALSGGNGTLLRGEGQDSFQGGLVFATTAPKPGEASTPDCEGALRVPALDISWPSGGHD